MRVSKKEWKSLLERVKRCEEKEKRSRQKFREMLLDMAKKILREPEELSKELDDLDKVKKFKTGDDVNSLFVESPICNEEENSDNRILVVDEETNGYKRFFDDVEDLKKGIMNVLDERTVKVIIKKRAVRDSSCGESTTNKEAR